MTASEAGAAAAPRDRDEVLAEVIHFYLDSGDFNGLSVEPSDHRAGAFTALLADGLIDVTSHRSYINPHIKPWSPHESWLQDEALAEAISGQATACIYPSRKAMASVDLSHLDAKPYEREMASGRGSLELVFFESPAIEQYRNDPRYWFDLDDFSVSWGISDEAWLDEDEPDRDKITSVRGGFAFLIDELEGDGPTNRFVCAFLCDLWKLTPTHQQRIRTWEAEHPNRLTPHPTWHSMQMGQWAEHIGLFDKVIAEIEALSDLWKTIFGAPLFRSTERHRSWGWLIRPSSNEWDQFILLTDQLLSENISSSALDAAGAPIENAQGERLGTLNRLIELFRSRTSAPKEQIDSTFAPLRRVRKERQRPAHAAKAPTTDAEAFVRQRELLIDLAKSLEALRRFFERHPKAVAAGWQSDPLLGKWLTV